MKKVAYYLVLTLIFSGCSEDAVNNDGQSVADTTDDTVTVGLQVSIPDTAFEQALIDLNFDNELDGEVAKSRIENIQNLGIDGKGITDLTGISAFDALENLNVRGNQLTSLDVSNNSNLLFLWAEDNELETVDVSGLSSLEKLGLDRNRVVQIAVRTNTALQLLNVAENRLESIDVSSNNALTDFIVVDNPLDCILVNQTQLDAIPTDWNKDEGDSYSLDCE